MSYSAYICKVKNVRVHPNADRLALGECLNDTVVLGLNTKEDDLLLYFPPDGRLSEDFCAANDLIGYKDPVTGERKGGFFDHKRKVRVQKFRGEPSYGFATEVGSLYKLATYFENTGKQKQANELSKAVDKLKGGDSFTELAGIPICEKYITKATRNAQGGSNKQKKPRKKNPRFPEHVDTKQFRYELNKIPSGAIIYLFNKKHGTSSRYGYVQVETQLPLPWYKCAYSSITGKKFKHETKFEWVHQAGSRRVELKDPAGFDYHGSSEYRFDFMKNIWPLLRKGEVIYGEIVGYTDNGRLIMQAHSTDKLDKKLRKQYGPQMIYKYGCPEGTHKFFVYRITQVNEDGHQFDLPWPQVEYRAAQLGLIADKPLIGPIIMGQMGHDQDDYAGDPSMDHQRLKDLVEQLVQGPDPIDPSHIREGVVLHIERGSGTYYLKQKSFEFQLLEGLIKEDPNYIDPEEAEDNEA